MRRIAIYFFWDKDGIVDDYNIYMLADLRKNTEKVIVVSNGEMEKEGYAKFEKVADLIIERENKGFDVWAYKKGIEYIGWDELAEYDELILMNLQIMVLYIRLRKCLRRWTGWILIFGVLQSTMGMNMIHMVSANTDIFQDTFNPALSPSGRE